MNLLVVDDQGPVGEIISRIAQQSGWNAIHTVSPDRLDEIVREEKIDVLLLDYAVEGNPRSQRNGLSIAEMLRQKEIRIPIVMFSGWPDLIDRKHAAQLGIMRVLEKPLSIQELRQCLSEAKKASQDASLV